MKTSIKVGQRYFWEPGIFPYEVISIDDTYVITKATFPVNCAPKRIYRDVFENAIANGIAKSAK